MRTSRLATVIRLRSLGESQSRVQWARSMTAEREAVEEVEAGRRVVESVASKRGRTDAARLNAAHLQGKAAVERLDDAEDARREAARRTELDRIDWTKAKSEAEAAERLAERRRTELATLAARTSADVLDDLVLVIRSARSRREAGQ